MKIVIDGQGVVIPSGSGGGGSGGNPVGTVISFLGLTAPADYLVCDGAEYEITAYPALADFFRQQFGSANHFGGDGTHTFSVPDLRNLFLRGYHGEAEEQLSGEVGEKQDGTEIPGVVTGISNRAVGIYPMSRVSGSQAIKVQNQDKAVSTTPTYGVITGQSAPASDLTGNIASYTARPVNMAVLYCIKAAESMGGGLEEYDTEDGWHVRKWSDGYVEMDLQYTQNNVFPETSWGSLYYQLAPVHAFPVPLVEKYRESCDIMGSSPPVRLILINQGSNSLTHTSQIGFALAGKLAVAVSVTVGYKVTGRWK